MQPSKSILNPAFRYTKSVNTDIRKTFARIRKEQQQQQKTVVQIKRKSA